MTEQSSKTVNDLIDILNSILKHTRYLTVSLDQFYFFSEKPKDYEKNVSDIRKIYEHTVAFNKELLKLEKEWTPQNSQKICNSEYLANVRHDLNNFINALLGYSELVLEDFQKNQEDSAINKFQEIHSNVQMIRRLINELRLDFVKGPQLVMPDVFKISGEALEGIGDEEYKAFKEAFSILIVDDVHENCLVLERFLKQLEFKKILIVHDGLKALEVLEKEKIDLICSDIAMPRMNGIELLRHLREQIRHHQIMVLMITGWDTIENEITCIQLGAVDILPKPFNVDILRVRIDSCVEKKWFVNKEALYRRQIEEDKQSYEKLLRSVFPPSIIEELVKTNYVQAKVFEDVAVLFTDVVGFTSYCDTHSSDEIMKVIQSIAEICEVAAANHGLQKIKTIGDGFLAISGMLEKSKNPVLDCIGCAEEILKQTSNLESNLKLRAGIDYGSVIGGIVGHHQYLYDIWSDTVNTAARVQTMAEPGAIYLSQDAQEQVVDFCDFQELGSQQIKGKKPINIFLFRSHKPSTKKMV